MNYENIKSVLLTLFVLLSLVLSWSLWTYQPNYGVIEKTRFIQDVNIGLKRGSTDLILPHKIMYHKNNRHYGTMEEYDIKEFMSEIREWNFDDFVRTSATTNEDYIDLFRAHESIEIIFPTEVPVETFKNILKIEDNEIEAVTFDRIVIPAIESQQENAVAYFISYNNHYVYEAKLNNYSYQEFYREIFQDATHYPQYFTYLTDASRIFYLPEEKVNAERITYYSISLDTLDFKDALFTNPSIVKQDFQVSGEESFSDGSRALFIDSSGDHLRYISPSSENVGQNNLSHELVQKSIDFVNDHSGWTDTYQLTEWNPVLQSTIFRLQINGLNVYNERGLSKVALTWDRTKLFDIYERPLFKLQVTIDSESSIIELPSGQSIIDLLNRTPYFDSTNLEAIEIGYEMIKDRFNAKVTLHPVWVIKHNGIWKKISLDEELREQGGNISVLE